MRSVGGTLGRCEHEYFRRFWLDTRCYASIIMHRYVRPAICFVVPFVVGGSYAHAVSCVGLV